MRRLTLVAELADRAPTLSLLGLRVLPWARDQAVNGISGDAFPFRLPVPDATPRG
jgi:hypothetical protein